ncbi:coiled-coil domain-containing protein [Isobaculum melis]|uniref:Uncharacterized protein n=1 Tax=Isobaculum melis TaxID=142588 RepID=A0A1H9RJJ2_9LACT|nr:hypothetical protein [Isobaculum melis]SER72874.1 hypothetical protein SAMN04488559_10493 [Isobaculum melis]
MEEKRVHRTLDEENKSWLPKVLSKKNKQEDIFEAYEDEIERLTNKNRDMQSKLMECVDALKKISEEKKQLEKEIYATKALPKHYEGLEDKLAQYEKTIERLSEKNSRLEQQIAETDKMTENYVSTEKMEQLSQNLAQEQSQYEALKQELAMKEYQLLQLQEEQRRAPAPVQPTMSTRGTSEQTRILEEQLKSARNEINVLKMSHEQVDTRLSEEKAEIAEVLVEAKLKAKKMLDDAIKEAVQIKSDAYEELEQVKGKAKNLNQQLEMTQHEANQVFSNLQNQITRISD